MGAKVRVRLFHELRSSVGQSELEVEGNTLNDVLQNLINKHGPLKDLLFDPHGELRGHTLFYINNLAQNPPDFSRKPKDGDLVLLVPPAAGG